MDAQCAQGLRQLCPASSGLHTQWLQLETAQIERRPIGTSAASAEQVLDGCDYVASCSGDKFDVEDFGDLRFAGSCIDYAAANIDAAANAAAARTPLRLVSAAYTTEQLLPKDGLARSISSIRRRRASR